jgi:hypothetical protein
MLSVDQAEEEQMQQLQWPYYYDEGLGLHILWTRWINAREFAGL